MVTAKKIVRARHFKGEPHISDFKILTEELPTLKDGEVLVEAEYLSVDPFMRVVVNGSPLGSTMVGHQIGRVLESKSPAYEVGDRVHGYFGWRTHTIFDANPGAPADEFGARPYKLPDLGKLPASLGLGVLGVPGNTAYFGFLEICKPKEGETVVVSGAAGAIGSLVGQIAKIKGCRVIGFTGSDEKVNWLLKLGFDAAYNYKTKDIDQALKESAPNGVDCYFDNVAGTISSVVLNHMNSFGRISLCGAISVYNADPSNCPLFPAVQLPMLYKQVTMAGFHVYRWLDRWFEGITQLHKWIRDGKIKPEETLTKGFENMPAAFIEMMKGQNIGKAIVQP